MLGTGLALGETASVLLWGDAFCWGYGGNSDLRAVVWVTMRGAFPMPDYALSHAVPAQRGCGTMCRATGLGQHKEGVLTGTTKHPLKVTAGTGYQKQFLDVAFVVEPCLKMFWVLLGWISFSL